MAALIMSPFGAMTQKPLTLYANDKGTETIENFKIDICGGREDVFVRIDLREARKYDRIIVTVEKKDADYDDWYEYPNYNPIDPNLSEYDGQRYLYIRPSGIVWNNEVSPRSHRIMDLCTNYKDWDGDRGRINVIGQKKDGTETYWSESSESFKTKNLYKFDKHIAQSEEYEYEITPEQIQALEDEEAARIAHRQMLSSMHALSDSVQNKYEKDFFLEGVPVFGPIVSIPYYLAPSIRSSNTIWGTYKVIFEEYFDREAFKQIENLSDQLLSTDLDKQERLAIREKIKAIPKDTDRKADKYYDVLQEYFKTRSNS